MVGPETFMKQIFIEIPC